MNVSQQKDLEFGVYRTIDPLIQGSEIKSISVFEHDDSVDSAIFSKISSYSANIFSVSGKTVVKS